eukprot:1146781-Pleurochrysis_carterae.AAC.1
MRQRRSLCVLLRLVRVSASRVSDAPGRHMSDSPLSATSGRGDCSRGHALSHCSRRPFIDYAQRRGHPRVRGHPQARISCPPCWMYRAA